MCHKTSGPYKLCLYLFSFFSFLCAAPSKFTIFQAGLCVITCLYVHAHAKWACITWHGIICIESSFNFQNHPFTNMLLTGHTVIDKIDHFCTFLSVLIKANWTLFPVSHTYIWSIAQWAIQRQCVKKISAVQKRIEEKKWETKGKTLFMT